MTFGDKSYAKTTETAEYARAVERIEEIVGELNLGEAAFEIIFNEVLGFQLGSRDPHYSEQCKLLRFFESVLAVRDAVRRDKTRALAREILGENGGP